VVVVYSAQRARSSVTLSLARAIRPTCWTSAVAAAVAVILCSEFRVPSSVFRRLPSRRSQRCSDAVSWSPCVSAVRAAGLQARQCCAHPLPPWGQKADCPLVDGDTSAPRNRRSRRARTREGPWRCAACEMG